MLGQKNGGRGEVEALLELKYSILTELYWAPA